MTNEKIILAEKTKVLIDNFLKKPGQSLLLFGRHGVGLGSIAKIIARKLCDNNYNILELVDPDSVSSISINAIRSLNTETRGSRLDKKIILVDDADKMTHQAQNAFLKMLEEPTPNIFFILTSHQKNNLLETILSRVQQINVLPIDDQKSQELIRRKLPNNKPKQDKILFMASGLPAEISRLTTNDAYFSEQSEMVSMVKKVISSNIYDRLLLVNQLSDKQRALEFVEKIALISGFMLQKTDNLQLVHATKLLNEVAKNIKANGHVKTQMTYLLINL